MRNAAVLVLIVGSAGSAIAQPLTGLVKWEASADGGATWLSHVEVPAGSAYKVRARASWTDGAMPSVGFAGASLRQVDLVGAVATDTFDIGSAFALKPDAGTPQVWTVQPGTGASEGYLKIDSTNPLSMDMDFGQFPKILPGGTPNPTFDASNPILLLEMDAVAASEAPGRLITISGPWFRMGTPLRNFFRTYTNERGANQNPLNEATQESVTIEVVPAPAGVLVVVGAAGVTLRRRR